MNNTRKFTAFLTALSLCTLGSCSSQVGSAGNSSTDADFTESTTAVEETTEEITEPETDAVDLSLKGNFYDANGVLLVSSEKQADGTERRVYSEEYGEPFANIITEMSAGYDTTFNDILTENGQSIQLTLDAELQKSIYEYLGEQKIIGSVVVLRTDGSIMSQVSYPSYDPNAVKEQKYDKELAWGEFGNKAFQNYEPGSCFKIMSEVLADKHGIYEQYDEGEWDFGSIPIVNWDHDRNTGYPMSRSLYSGFVNSSNIFFAKTFDQIGTEDVLADLSSIFHFGADEKDDIICDFGSLENNIEIYCDDDLRRSAFGQSYVLTCPIFLAALGREAVFGDMVTPFVVKNIVDTADGKTVIGEGSKSCDVIASIPEQYRENLRNGMQGVGSGLGVYLPEQYKFYAKTGTAETWVDDFLYITGILCNTNDKPETEYADYSKYSENGSYVVVMQIQNPTELGYAFASESQALYRGIVDIVMGKE